MQNCHCSIIVSQVSLKTTLRDGRPSHGLHLGSNFCSLQTSLPPSATLPSLHPTLFPEVQIHGLIFGHVHGTVPWEGKKVTCSNAIALTHTSMQPDVSWYLSVYKSSPHLHKLHDKPLLGLPEIICNTAVAREIFQKWTARSHRSCLNPWVCFW